MACTVQYQGSFVVIDTHQAENGEVFIHGGLLTRGPDGMIDVKVGRIASNSINADGISATIGEQAVRLVTPTTGELDVAEKVRGFIDSHTGHSHTADQGLPIANGTVKLATAVRPHVEVQFMGGETTLTLWRRIVRVDGEHYLVVNGQRVLLEGDQLDRLSTAFTRAATATCAKRSGVAMRDVEQIDGPTQVALRAAVTPKLPPPQTLTPTGAPPAVHPQTVNDNTNLWITGTIVLVLFVQILGLCVKVDETPIP
ncbi:MAG: hypothetical protein SP1CHLAM54_11450 [Chlamydiia bacterium]|nr:hypothetical protein [Chlamydiia bacterium]MCH9616048.1 hypothetical protein [Chlamydiia bacterium]MCH9629071.1 hypothetical protein [Chlamydiia bacterium]